MRRIKQSISSIYFKLMTTAHFDTINQIKNDKQAHKQVKHDVEMSVVPLIFSISSESSALFVLDLIPITFIVQGITQSLNDGISQSSSAFTLNSSSITSISSIMMQLPDNKTFMHFISSVFNSNFIISISSITTQLLSDEIFMHFISPALDPSSAMMVPSITRQLASGGNSAGISSAVLQ